MLRHQLKGVRILLKIISHIQVFVFFVTKDVKVILAGLATHLGSLDFFDGDRSPRGQF